MKLIFGGAIVYLWEFIMEYKVYIVIVILVLLALYFWVVKLLKDEIIENAKKQGGFNTIFDQTEVQIKNRETCDNLDQMVEETVTIRTVGGHGSGFVVNTDKGYLIITNSHVTGDNQYIQIVHHDGEEEYGRIERKDDSVDVALISFLNKYGRKGVTLAKELPSIGDEVFAIGSPLDEEYSNSVSKGIISSTNRVINGQKYIQSDVTINLGNSGGPLVSKSNEVVGVAVSGLAGESGDTNLGVNHFIPISEVLRSLRLSI